MKPIKERSGDLKQEQKKATNRSTMGLTTDIDSQAPNHLGPVVQSVVSLTSSLRVISLTVLADSIYNILYFLLNKCE